MSAYMMGELHRNEEQKVFDWIKAANLIKERGATEASAGLSQDWEYTAGMILSNGKPASEDERGSLYLASTWAIPEIEIDGETMDCFCMESEHPEWDAETFWPPEALAILGLPEISEAP